MARNTLRCAICGHRVALTKQGIVHVSGKASLNGHRPIVTVKEPLSIDEVALQARG